MLRNYLKIALRNLKRNKGYALINIFGLALSMAVCLLIITFIWEQMQYDEFHEHKDRIVRIITDHKDMDRPYAAAPAPLAPVLERTVPEVEETVRLYDLRGNLVHDENALRVQGLYVDASFFDVFSFKLAQGDPQTALADPYSLVLTQEMARKLFGDTNPVGKMLAIEDAYTGDAPYMITGVLEEPPGPSHLQFDVLASFSTLRASSERSSVESWQLIKSYPTYVLLHKGTSPSELINDLSRIVETHYSENDRGEVDLYTQALTDINPGPYYASPVEFRVVPSFVIYFLGGLGLILLLTACFNYVGLSVARSMERATEVGVRKVAGASRRQLAGQFLAEAVLFALLALVLAYGLLSWLAPAFNRLQFVGMFNWQISSTIYDPKLLLLFTVFSICVGLLAGLYPAVRLSSFQPVKVLKGIGNLKGLGGLNLRKGLIVVQFALALIFIISTVQLYRQYDYMANAEFGLETEQIINVSLQDVSHEMFREELLRYPAIEGVSATMDLPPDGGHSVELAFEGQTLQAEQHIIGLHFIDNMGLTLLAGRSFSSAFGRDSVESIIINETAARVLRFDVPAEAVGRGLSMDTNIMSVGRLDVQIIGVVKNYQFDNFTEPIGPLVLWYWPEKFWYANVRVRPGQFEAAKAAIEKTWEKLDPVHPVEYQRYEVQIAQRPMNLLFQDLAHVVGWVAILAIAIAYLGLLGMATYTAQTRVKEVGIRKVLGATATDVVVLLSKDFLKLVLIGVIVAVPLAWYVNSLWLREFARRISFNGWVIGGSVAAVLLVALLTIGSQTLKAALANPVDSLRYE